jgi:hypothetical protein
LLHDIAYGVGTPPTYAAWQAANRGLLTNSIISAWTHTGSPLYTAYSAVMGMVLKIGVSTPISLGIFAREVTGPYQAPHPMVHEMKPLP